MEDIKSKLVDKSIEAFILGLEIYNKPTIRYRIEGFSFFICNAWELMLKAELLNRGESIYFSNHISQNFLTINANYDILSSEQIRLKYPPEIAEKFIQQSNDIDVLSS